MQDFVNRAAEQEIFHHCLAEKEDHRVLVFHGIDGIGKTSLLNKLRDELAEEGVDGGAISGSVNFVEPAYGRPDEALKRLRRSLAKSAKAAKTPLMFNAFDLAIYAYTDKAFGKERSQPLGKELSELSDGPIYKMLRTTGRVGASYIPVAGAFFRDVVDAAIEYMKAEHALAWARCETELRRLPEMEDQEILKRLPFFFGEDLSFYRQRTAARQVALFLDSYDELWGALESEQRRRGSALRDEWVRDLVDAARGVLFVVAGRNRLAWDKSSPAGTARLTQHELKALERDDALQLLAQNGIEERDISDMIFHVTQGHPFWLDLTIGQYLRLKGDGRPLTPHLFDLRESTLLERLCAGLTGEEQQTVKQLSAVFSFDEELFKRLISGPLATGYPPQAFADFTRLSFVKRLAGGSYYIHGVMKEPMLRELAEKDATLLRTLRIVQSKYFAEQGFPFGIDVLLQGVDDLRRVFQDFLHGRMSRDDLVASLDSELLKQTRAAAKRLQEELDAKKKVGAELLESIKKSEETARVLREDAERMLKGADAPNPPGPTDASASGKPQENP